MATISKKASAGRFATTRAQHGKVMHRGIEILPIPGKRSATVKALGKALKSQAGSELGAQARG